MNLFHYTTADDEHLGSILRDGVIRPTAILIENGERPAAWFSAEPWWEPTATKWVRNSKGNLEQPSENELAWLCGLARIQVRVGAAPHTWKDFKARAGASPKFVRLLERSASIQGARPWLWRVSFEAVPMAEWIRVEQRHGDGPWIDVAVPGVHDGGSR